MTLRIAGMSRIGIAAALSVSLVGNAAAQVASDQRVRITSKDAGEVITRVDTHTVYRTDTLRVYRTDTVRVNVNVPGATVTNTVTRYDTVRMEMLPSWMKRPSGLYFGLGGGVAIPSGALNTAQSNGYAFQGQVGIDPAGSPLGLRLDVNWARYDDQEPYKVQRARPEVLNFSGDLKLKAPTLSKSFPITLYAIGGGNYIMYKDLLIELDQTTPGTLAGNVAPSDQKWHDKWGFNAGAGFSLGWGSTELFVESRLINFKPANASNSKQVPLIIGVNWY